MNQNNYSNDNNNNKVANNNTDSVDQQLGSYENQINIRHINLCPRKLETAIMCSAYFAAAHVLAMLTHIFHSPDAYCIS